MKRSKWKGQYIDNSIIKLSKILKTKKQLKVWSRRSVIPAFLVDKNVYIHNGKEFKKITITREKVGFKFGEFCGTRTFKSRQ